MSHPIGKRAEDFACEYLQHQGLQLLSRNFSTRYGEIDIIMQTLTLPQLVFIEVRYRHRADFIAPAETITANKQQKLIQAARYYLHCHPKLQPMPCRFDVIALTHPLQYANIEWIQNAWLC